VIITREDGCEALFREDRSEVRLDASAPRLEPIAKVGSGDALLAGFLAARTSGKSIEDAVRAGVATGAASVLEAGAGRFDVREANRLTALVDVKRLEPVTGD
jgi:1-phosphofructokinase/tagatose 6-phosphate kinase